MRTSLPALGTAFLLRISQGWAGEPNTLSERKNGDGRRLLYEGKSPAGRVAFGGSEFSPKGWPIGDGLLEQKKGGGGGDTVATERFELT